MPYTRRQQEKNKFSKKNLFKCVTRPDHSGVTLKCRVNYLRGTRAKISTIVEGDTPLANCVPSYLGLAYCVSPLFGLAYCVPFNKKKKPNHFGRFHLHKEDKLTVCCMHTYNHS